MYEERKYRNLFKGVNLKFFDVCVFESDLRIGASKELYEEALKLLLLYRNHIETYAKNHPVFLTALSPIACQPDSAEIIKKMCQAAMKAGVGPMASVAGAVSEMVGMSLLKHSDEVIVENGGDIFIKTDTTRKIGVYAGNSPLNEKLAINIEPQKTPLGICTSSGTIGHSLSFGKADAAVIISKDTFLADAVATAAANIIKTKDDIERGLEFASEIQGIDGALIIKGERFGAWGDIKLVRF